MIKHDKHWQRRIKKNGNKNPKKKKVNWINCLGFILLCRLVLNFLIAIQLFEAIKLN